MSQIAYGNPAFDKWIAKTKQSYQPYRVAFVSAWKEGAPLSFLPLQGTRLGFIDIMPHEDARLASLFNPFKSAGEEQTLTAFSQALGLSAIVLAGDQSPWVLASFASGRRIELAQGPAGNGSNVAAWLTSVLGYEGVVVDQKGDFWLVATLPGKLKARAQGIVIADSTQSLVANRSEGDKGVALIELVYAKGDMGVFRSVMRAKTKAIGSKVVLQEPDPTTP